MATKKKTTKTKAAAKTKTVKAAKIKAPKTDRVAKVKADDKRNYIEEPKFNTNAHDGEKSGAFIKRMLETNALTTQEIVEVVKENFPNSKVSGSDVGFHRSKLKQAGVETQVVRVDKDGGRYTLAA